MLAFPFSSAESWLCVLALILISVALTSLCGSAPDTSHSPPDDA
ncbi:hypothetical protein [Paraburkholderia bengalensis]